MIDSTGAQLLEYAACNYPYNVLKYNKNIRNNGLLNLALVGAITQRVHNNIRVDNMVSPQYNAS